MSEPIIYTAILLFAIIAMALGYTLSALRGRREIEDLRHKYVELNSKLAQERTDTTEKFSSVEKMRHGLEQTISSIAPEELNTHQPIDKNRFAEVMLEPLQETLKNADAQVKRISREGEKSKKLLERQLNILRAPHQLGRGSSKAIANSLGDAETRKRWGKKTLMDFLELTYMTDHYRVVGKEDDKRTEFPPCLIDAADKRRIAIDVNTPLEPYVSICQAPDASVRSWHMETHARKLRERIMAMSSHAYKTEFPEAPHMMILLILNDHYLTAALEIDDDLLTLAENQKIILATPTDLLTLLQTIAFTWQHQQFAGDARKMRETGVHLYRHFGTFIKLVAELGSELTGVLDSYNRAVNFFEAESQKKDGTPAFLDNNENDDKPSQTEPSAVNESNEKKTA